jgi:hypothetical protein
MPGKMKNVARSTLFLATWGAVLSLAACGPPGPIVVEATPSGRDSTTTTSAPSPTTSTSGTRASDALTWRSASREVVDLWLHGFAMLQADSSLVPYFDRGYRERMLELRRQRGVTTGLDANAERLRTDLDAARRTSAQFVALYFDSWESLRSGYERFSRLAGNARAARSNEEAQAVATFAAYFPSASDRDWLRLYMQALEDERQRFYHQYWVDETRARASARAAFDVQWLGTYHQKFAAFLRNSQWRSGDLVLSLSLGGEGRTLSVPAGTQVIAVPFPARNDDASDPIYVLAHELAGSPSAAAVRDQTSAAEQRNGVADRYMSLAAVRGGAILLSRVAPELMAGYERYYLRVAGRTPPASGDVAALFASTFPVPDAMRDEIARQIDIIVGGI